MTITHDAIGHFTMQGSPPPDMFKLIQPARQRSCGKVMFSQVSVILFRGWVGVSLVMTTSWVCPGEGLGVCPGRELCPEGGGYVQAGRYVQSGVGMSRGLSYIDSQKFGHYFETIIS